MFDGECFGGVELGRVFFCDFQTFAFDRFDMEDHGAVEVACFSEELDKCGEVVAVDWTNGEESEFLEPRILVDRGFGHLTHAVVRFAEE